jgi:hypothetical protein
MFSQGNALGYHQDAPLARVCEGRIRAGIFYV